MTLLITKLLAVCPPPRAPVDNDGSWETVEGTLGFRLPADFKAIVSTYGAGTFGEFIHLLNPFAPGEGCLTECSARILEADRSLAAQFPEMYTSTLHPEPGGLFPWGLTANGNVLYWAVHEDPDSWTVAVGAARGPERELVWCGVAEFLAGWLEGRVQPEAFPPHDEHSEPRFDARRKLRYLDVYVRFVEAPYDQRLLPVRSHLDLAVCRGVHSQPAYSSARFRASDDATMVQYSDNAGHGARLNLLFPPEAEAFWKARVRALRDATGWFIWRVSDAEGQKHWEELVNDPGR